MTEPSESFMRDRPHPIPDAVRDLSELVAGCAPPLGATSAVAAMLDGVECTDVDGHPLVQDMKARGLVVVYGLSDDLIEVSGAVRDEIDAYQGEIDGRDDGEFHLDEGGFAGNVGLRASSASEDEEPEAEPIPAGARTIRASFGGSEEGPWWTFATDIPHSTFTSLLHGRPFSRCLVMRLADAVATDPAGAASE